MMKKVILTEQQFSHILNEVRYISTSGDKRNFIHDRNGEYKVKGTDDDNEPISANDKIRVFHGTDMTTAYKMAMEGISGNEPTSRAYSYENGMNPAGLFVTTDFYQAKEFGFHSDNVVIIEFTAKATDLDTPVWNNSSTYFAQGSNPQPFINRGERTTQWIKYRNSAKDNGDERVEKSFNPAMADKIFNNYEHQALFYGNLNPNMIKRLWVKDMGFHSDNDEKNYMANFIPYSRKDFLREFSHRYESTFKPKKLYKPDEELDSIEELAERMLKSTRKKSGRPITQQDIDNFVNNIQDKVENNDYAFSQYLKERLFPKQLIILYNNTGYRENFNKFHPQNYSQNLRENFLKK